VTNPVSHPSWAGTVVSRLARCRSDDGYGVDPLAAGGLERIELEAGVLIPGGDPREPDQHGVLPKLAEMCHEQESDFKGRLREADQRPNHAFPLPTAFPSQTGRFRGPQGYGSSATAAISCSAGRGGGGADAVRDDPAPDRPLARAACGDSLTGVDRRAAGAEGENHALRIDQRHPSGAA
jgi:hypothetical protein